MKTPNSNSTFRPRRGVISRRSAGFTMIEIALCLAIIAFGLVAIIGVLPAGLDVQKINREETIINQDANLWIDAIRSGAQGHDDLTNYVIAITNYWTQYDANTNSVRSDTDGFTSNLAPSYNHAYGSDVRSVGGVPQAFGLLSGGVIVGLLSTPKYSTPPYLGPGQFQSNYVVAFVRSMSGPAVEKSPQNDRDVLESSFRYRMIAEVVSYVPYDSFGTNFSVTPTNAALARMRILNELQNNSRDLRLMFRWPLLPSGEAGNRRLTFRVFTGGTQTNINLPNGLPLYFFQPTIYAQAP